MRAHTHPHDRTHKGTNTTAHKRALFRKMIFPVWYKVLSIDFVVRHFPCEIPVTFPSPSFSTSDIFLLPLLLLHRCSISSINDLSQAAPVYFLLLSHDSLSPRLLFLLLSSSSAPHAPLGAAYKRILRHSREISDFIRISMLSARIAIRFFLTCVLVHCLQVSVKGECNKKVEPRPGRTPF